MFLLMTMTDISVTLKIGKIFKEAGGRAIVHTEPTTKCLAANHVVPTLQRAAEKRVTIVSSKFYSENWIRQTLLFGIVEVDFQPTVLKKPFLNCIVAEVKISTQFRL